jgi:hypothetical protein
MSLYPSLSVPAVPDVHPEPSHARLRGFRAALVFAGLLPLVWGVSSIAEAIAGGSHLLHDLIGGGVVMSALWLAPLVAMWRPQRFPAALPYYSAVVAGSVVAAGMSNSNWAVGAILLIQGGLVALLHPYRRTALRRGVVISPLLLPVALLAGAALVRYAVSEAGLQATGDSHAVVSHYYDMAWFAITVVLLAVLAALRDDARRFAGRAAAFALVAFGAVSVAYPTMSSSVGSGWGAAAIVAGLGMVAVIEVEDRRTGGRETAITPAE